MEINMYFNKLKESKTSHKNWPADCPNGQRHVLNRLMHICDVTTGSWVEVHDDFEELQGNASEPTHAAHKAFVRHCTRVAHLEGMTPSRYHVEIVAYALLLAWIEYHATEQELGDATTSMITLH